MTNTNDQVIDIETLLKENDVKQEVIDEVVRMFDNKKTLIPKEKEDKGEEAIRMRLLDEKDWRKKASLSARLISKSIE